MKSVIKKAVTAASVISVGASIFCSVPAFGEGAGNIIYINGVDGSDDNDGSLPDVAVKTFEKAKDLAKDSSVKEIHVTGAITVDTDADWDMQDADNKPFVRESGYTGNFVIVKEGATLDLGNITFDGAGVGYSSSVVKVEKGATLNYKEGALIMNNITQSTGNKYTSVGGAVLVNGGTMNMSGGVIRDCYSIMGGGVGVIQAGAFNMSGGTITNNVAGEDNDHDAGGGGVFLGTSSSMEMSGGEISNNTSGYVGGGISMGIIGNSLMVSNSSLGYSDKMHFTMTGGEINGNVSYNTGGGLYVECNCVADIVAGDFRGNSTLGKGDYCEFGGGAIYVNSECEADYGDGRKMILLDSGELNTNYVNISGNEAVIAGGGIASCKTSVCELNIETGSVIFGNKANSSGPDIFASSISGSLNTSLSPHLDVSECMLNGAPYLWKNDRNLNVRLDLLKNQSSLQLHNDYTGDEEAIKESVEMAKVNIIGNTSGTRGGGIGNNGIVRIGTVPEKTIDIHAKKVWDDEESDVADRPPVVKLWLVRDGVRIVSQNATKSSGWTTVTFKDQPVYNWITGEKFEYSIEEDSTWFNFSNNVVSGKNVLEKYDPQVNEDPDVENGFIVTNPIKRDLEISKTVVNEVNPDDDKKFEFTIEIKDPEGNPYEDMVFIVSPDSSKTEVTLTDGKYVFELGNGEKLTVKGLKTGSTYTVTETEDKNYKTTANEEAGTQYSGTIDRLCNAEVKYENTYSEEETTTTTEEETTEEETTEEETTGEETTEEETTEEETTEEETTTTETTTAEETTTQEETTEEETTTETTTAEETTEEETTTTETTTAEETTTVEETTTAEETTTETTTAEETTTVEETTTAEETTTETTTAEETTTETTTQEETDTAEPTETETATETEAIKETAEESETAPTDSEGIIEESEEIKVGEAEEETDSSEVTTAGNSEGSESSESASSEAVVLAGGSTQKPSGGVNTGDGNNSAVFIAIACASAAGLAATVAIAGKKKKDNE